MLVLTRKIGEEIQIGDDILITVCKPHPEQPRNVVRIGISAPRSVTILRGELIGKYGQPPAVRTGE